MSKAEKASEDEDFLTVLEDGVRQVLKNRKASPSDRLSAVNAGAKLLAIKHKLSLDNEDNFFSKG